MQREGFRARDAGGATTSCETGVLVVQCVMILLCAATSSADEAESIQSKAFWVEAHHLSKPEWWGEALA